MTVTSFNSVSGAHTCTDSIEMVIAMHVLFGTTTL